MTRWERIRAWVKEHRVALAYGLLVVVIAAGLFRLEVVANNAQRVADENSRQNERLEQIVADLAAEARERTTESCALTQQARDDLRRAFLGLYDAFDQALAEAGRPPSPFIAAQRAELDQNFPPLTCPQDQGPIIVPKPTPTP
jgi:ParB-like chromosome segregation protein Spo0J